jgi:hypothetical protein
MLRFFPSRLCVVCSVLPLRPKDLPLILPLEEMAFCLLWIQ